MKRIKALFQALQKKAFGIEIRFRFVLSSVLLTLLMAASTFFTFEYWIVFLPLFFISCYLLCYFALLEGVERVEWLTLFFMPIALTLSFYLFYFLFPIRWLTRLPFITIYGISIYAVLLCANIFNVGVEKSLQLYRAAFSVNFFDQMFISFLLYSSLLSFKLDFIFNTLLVGLLSFLLAFQLIWSVKLELKINKEMIFSSLLIGVVVGQLALIGSFTPIKSTIFALFLTSSYYSLSGLVHSFLDQRLFKETIREYLLVWLAVFVITVLSIRW